MIATVHRHTTRGPLHPSVLERLPHEQLPDWDVEQAVELEEDHLREVQQAEDDEYERDDPRARW